MSAKPSVPMPESTDPYEDEKVQMYNLRGEYPELPSRLLAWPDYCTQVARAESAEASLAAKEVELREATSLLDRARECMRAGRVRLDADCSPTASPLEQEIVDLLARNRQEGGEAG